MIKGLAILLTLFSVTACGHMPTTDNRALETVSHIQLSGFPVGAAVTASGKLLGITTEEKTTTVKAPAGTHDIIVSLNGKTLYSKTMFIGKNITAKIIY